MSTWNTLVDLSTDPSEDSEKSALLPFSAGNLSSVLTCENVCVHVRVHMWNILVELSTDPSDICIYIYISIYICVHI